MAGRGSRHHAALDSRRWAKARKAALERAGWKSELSGLRGRLEVHHKVKLEHGGAPYDLDNLIVVTRSEHIRIHRDEILTPAQIEWRAFVEELVTR